MTDIKLLERMASSIRAAQMHLKGVDADSLSEAVSDEDCWTLDGYARDVERELDKLLDHVDTMADAREG